MYNKFVKRFLDLLISILILPICAILYIIIGILIKIEDKGPIFYKGNRVGKDKKIFKMYKFRSMKVNSPNIMVNDSTYNDRNDPRVTKIGKFIRETSLDEIPQILNVLKGEMSIIGPRPTIPELLPTYKPDEEDKMKVKPGITGYTQAYYRNGIIARKQRLIDVWYANNVKFSLDVKIFFKTISTIIKRKNIYSEVNNTYSKETIREEKEYEESINNK